jgi:hypothetical protein
MKLQHSKIGTIPSPREGEGQDEGVNTTIPYIITSPLSDGNENGELRLSSDIFNHN